MEDLSQINNTLGFIENLIAQELKSAGEILNLSKPNEPYMILYEEEKEKLPYHHINLIDEIRADENAHSRILTKLLQQKTPCGKFEILESFVQFIKEKAKKKSASFDKIQINDPVTTSQKRDIDIWIRDKKYAIIIENKIKGANDQEKQLKRYIEETIKSFKNEQIYVIYLSDNAPKDQTWGKYKEEFEPRFLHLSFREDILTWLTDHVLPIVRLKEKEKYLSAVLEQYIDHLEGEYKKRNINQKMNMELQELIKKEWELNDKTPQENLAKLIEKRQVTNNINNQIIALIIEYERKLFKKWRTDIKSKYPDCEHIYIPANYGLGLKIMVQQDTYVEVFLDVSDKSDCIWCTVRSVDKDREMPQEIVDKVDYLLGEIYPLNVDDYHHRTVKTLPRLAYEEAFVLLCDVIEVLTDKKNGLTKV